MSAWLRDPKDSTVPRKRRCELHSALRGIGVHLWRFPIFWLASGWMTKAAVIRKRRPRPQVLVGYPNPNFTKPTLFRASRHSQPTCKTCRVRPPLRSCARIAWRKSTRIERKPIPAELRHSDFVDRAEPHSSQRCWAVAMDLLPYNRPFIHGEN